VGVRTVNGRKLVAPGGGGAGFNSHMAHYPERDITAAFTVTMEEGRLVIQPGRGE
jgi:hypothetical protein